VIAEPPLRDLALAMKTDKEGAHSYTGPYEQHLARFRHRPITLLEIGVGGYADATRGGASLRMWKAYFPLGNIVGLDIEDKSQFAEDRVTILQGSQADVPFLERVGAQFGPFDIVIDDGSHRCGHVITTFGALFPHVKSDGVYVVEDLQTSYWERYGGSSRPNTAGTSMTMLQRLTDGLNYAEFDIPNYKPAYSDQWIKSLSFYHNIAFIEKGPNLERSNMLPPHPRASRRYALAGSKHRSVNAARGAARRAIPWRIRAAVLSRFRGLSVAVRRLRP
jgi:hypothetical protein